MADKCPLFKVIEGLAERTSSLVEDQGTINTAINRIERKQNRWLEIINERDLVPSQDEKEEINSPPALSPAMASLAGEPTEE